MILPDTERQSAHARPTHAVDILAFVEAQEIPFDYFERPYYLQPAPGGERAYALLRETPEVHRMAAARAAHRNGDVFPAGLHDFRVPFAEHAQPPAEIAAAIGARRAIMRSNRQIDALARALQLVGYLHA